MRFLVPHSVLFVVLADAEQLDARVVAIHED